MRIVTGDLPPKAPPDDGCTQAEAVDDLLICGEDLEVDGVGGVLGMSVRQIYKARSHYHKLISRNFLCSSLYQGMQGQHIFVLIVDQLQALQELWDLMPKTYSGW